MGENHRHEVIAREALNHRVWRGDRHSEWSSEEESIINLLLAQSWPAEQRKGVPTTIAKPRNDRLTRLPTAIGQEGWVSTQLRREDEGERGRTPQFPPLDFHFWKYSRHEFRIPLDNQGYWLTPGPKTPLAQPWLVKFPEPWNLKRESTLTNTFGSGQRITRKPEFLPDKM